MRVPLFYGLHMAKHTGVTVDRTDRQTDGRTAAHALRIRDGVEQRVLRLLSHAALLCQQQQIHEQKQIKEQQQQK